MTGICGLSAPRKFVRAQSGDRLTDIARRCWPEANTEDKVKHLRSCNPMLGAMAQLQANQLVFVEAAATADSALVKNT